MLVNMTGSLDLGTCNKWASLVPHMVRNLPAMQETQVGSLGLGDPLEKEKANPGFSCLENPMDRGVWWATVHVVTESWT